MAHIALALSFAGIGFWFHNRPQLKYTSPFDSELSALSKDFDLGTEKLTEICNNFLREMREGLEPKGNSSLAMIPTFVTKLPTGSEKGTAYAIDLGGSNLRILKLTLDGKGNITPTVTRKEIPQTTQQGKGEDLFGFVAEAVKEAQGSSTDSAPLGFTFSFPIDQTSLNSGVLIKWTKNFTASDVVGADVVSLLDKAFVQKGVNLKVTALINDTVGTQLAGCYQEPGSVCFCGVILGTGSNCCYLEKTANIRKYSDKKGSENMIINMECGNFGSRSDRIGLDLPLTEFDRELDANSNNKNHQFLEKQISGMYLGEITRLILRKYIKKGLLFEKFADKLSVPYGFTTEQMSRLEGDSSADLSVVNEVLVSHGITAASFEEKKFVKSVSHLVGNRGAQLAAIQIAAIYKQVTATSIPSTPLVAAVDGSVYEKYPNFDKIMIKTLNALVGENRIKLVLAKDGSGNGAALASVANA